MKLFGDVSLERMDAELRWADYYVVLDLGMLAVGADLEREEVALVSSRRGLEPLEELFRRANGPVTLHAEATKGSNSAGDEVAVTIAN